MTERKGGLAALDYIWLLPPALVVGILVGLRLWMPLRMPVPWPDETWFVAPAFALSATGSFFDPGINPDRVAMWMPPGYEILLAGVFWVFGYAFTTARWISTIAALVSFAVILGWCRCLLLPQGRWRLLLGAGVVALSFLSPNEMISAGIARMDQVFVTVVLLAAAASMCGRDVIACAIVAAAAVIHFNAIYFVIPVLLPLLCRCYRERRLIPRVDALDVCSCLAAAVILGGYGLYVALHFHAFVEDMRVQFAGKFAGAPRSPNRQLWHLLAATGFTCAIAWKRRSVSHSQATIVALFGCGLVAMTDFGGEPWYDFAQGLGMSLVAIAALVTSELPRSAGIAATAAAIVFSFQLCTEISICLPRIPPWRQWVVSPSEIARVRMAIATEMKPGDSVNFGFAGMEPIFLKDLYRAHVQWVIPVHDVTHTWPMRSSTWTVRCDSADFSAASLRYDLTHVRKGLDTPCVIAREPRQ